MGVIATVPSISSWAPSSQNQKGESVLLIGHLLCICVFSMEVLFPSDSPWTRENPPVMQQLWNNRTSVDKAVLLFTWLAELCITLSVSLLISQPGVCLYTRGDLLGVTVTRNTFFKGYLALIFKTIGLGTCLLQIPFWHVYFKYLLHLSSLSGESRNQNLFFKLLKNMHYHCQALPCYALSHQTGLIQSYYSFISDGTGNLLRLYGLLPSIPHPPSIYLIMHSQCPYCLCRYPS